MATHVLESMSADSLNRLHDGDPPSKKRKTGDDTFAILSTSTICIQTHSAALSDDIYRLEPIAILPRSRLPFSWLDTPSPAAQVQSGSLFVAHIPDLEDEPRGARVLAVRLLVDYKLYVVERVKGGVYSLLRLAGWVGEDDVLAAWSAWDGSFVRENTGAGEGVPEAAEWWEGARVGDPESGSMVKKGRFEVSLVFGSGAGDVSENDWLPDAAESGRQSVAPLERCSSSDANLLTPLESSQDAAAGFNADALRPAQELLDSLRDQYLQALYISKTSLAYFAKGPLTRCRTAFQSVEQAESKKPADLISFYRDAILNAKKMDLKYRETLPATIRDVVITLSEDESAPRKKPKRRKKALGKNGLYSEEEGFIRKWWKDRSLAENGLLIETSQEPESKKHIGDLRLRETQLQILLILETIALESAAAEEAKKINESEKTDETPKPKSKKSQDLNVLLELHLDRLCIWHAVSAEETTVPDSIKAGASHLSGKKVESDAVRDFCTEVIIPFYASRLPDKCKLITRKFGVSGTSSPRAKQPLKKTPRAQPGSTAKREQPKARRSLHRVLTDEQSTSQTRPSLVRSRTTPANPGARRESMEPLLPILNSNVRGGIQKAKRIENREVDLNAAARQHETKLKKVQMLVDQKKELDAAIHALRKPNRELVSRDIADDADQRKTSGSSRKQKNPARNPLGHGVQVMATPKGPRKKDMVVGMPPLPKSFVQTSAGQTDSSPLRGSDIQVVPSSSLRPKSFPAPSPSRIPGSDINQGDIGAIQETPTRRPPPPPPPPFSSAVDQSPVPKGRNPFRIPNRPVPRSTDIAPSTPVSTRKIDISHAQPVPGPNTSSMIMETPPKQNPKPPDFAPASRSPPVVVSTPAKNTTNVSVSRSSKVPVTPEKSIYEQLGWDDDELAL